MKTLYDSGIKKLTKEISTQKRKIQYVEVQEEPDHKEFFRNPFVRAYRATIRTGHETLYHRHCENTVYIVLQGGCVGTETVEPKGIYPIVFMKSFRLFTKIQWGLRNLFLKDVNMPNGFTFLLLHNRCPVIHKAVASKNNLMDIEMMGIEIFGKAKPHTAELLPSPLVLEYRADNFCISALKLAHGESYKVLDKNACLIIGRKFTLCGASRCGFRSF